MKARGNRRGALLADIKRTQMMLDKDTHYHQLVCVCVCVVCGGGVGGGVCVCVCVCVCVNRVAAQLVRQYVEVRLRLKCNCSREIRTGSIHGTVSVRPYG